MNVVRQDPGVVITVSDEQATVIQRLLLSGTPETGWAMAMASSIAAIVASPTLVSRLFLGGPHDGETVCMRADRKEYIFDDVPLVARYVLRAVYTAPTRPQIFVYEGRVVAD